MKETEYKIPKAQWYGPSSQLTIRGFQIKDPLVYVTKSDAVTKAPDYMITLRSEQAGTLKYKDDKFNRRSSNPLCRSYCSLPLSEKNVFLDWLQRRKKRNGTLTLKYAFIYFFGLEYRVLEEKKDMELVANEIIDLLQVYGNISVFKYHGERLLLYILNKMKDQKAKRELVEKAKAFADSRYKRSLSFTLGKATDIEVTDENITSLVFSLKQEAKIKKEEEDIQDHAKSYFYSFFKKFAEKEINQLFSNIRLRRVNTKYHPASRCIRDQYSYKTFSMLMDATASAEFIKKWEKAHNIFYIWDECPYMTYSEFFEFVPKSFRDFLENPLQKKLEKIESKLIGKVVSLSEVTKVFDMKTLGKLTKIECKHLLEELALMNIIIEPDPLYFFKSASKLDEKCILAKMESPSMMDVKSKNYELAVDFVNVNMDIVCDGRENSLLKEDEADMISSFASSLFLKSDMEKDRLRLRMELYKAIKPKMNKMFMSGIFRRLFHNLTLKQLDKLSVYVMKTTLANKTFTPEKDKKIRMTFSKLGLGNGYVNDIYAKFDLLLKSSYQKGEVFFREQKEFNINQTKLAQLEADTKQVNSVLSSIIKTEEEPTSRESFRGANRTQEPQKKGESKTGKASSFSSSLSSSPKQEEAQKRGKEKVLDKKHLRFMKEALLKNEWEKRDLRQKAMRERLMISAAISKINEWSEENYGDHLILEEEKYYLQDHIKNQVSLGH